MVAAGTGLILSDNIMESLLSTHKGAYMSIDIDTEGEVNKVPIMIESNLPSFDTR